MRKVKLCLSILIILFFCERNCWNSVNEWQSNELKSVNTVNNWSVRRRKKKTRATHYCYAELSLRCCIEMYWKWTLGQDSSSRVTRVICCADWEAKSWNILKMEICSFWFFQPYWKVGEVKLFGGRKFNIFLQWKCSHHGCSYFSQ